MLEIRRRLLMCAVLVATLALHPSMALPSPAQRPDLDEVSALLKSGRNHEAEAAARVLLREAEHGSAADSLQVADVLDLLVRAMRRGGKSGDETRAFAGRAVRIRERALGTKDPSYAMSLQNMALLDIADGEFKKALPVLERVLEIQERVLGPSHLDLTSTLVSLAAVRAEMGDLPAAEALARRALTIRESALGPEHEEVAECLNVLAVLDYRSGDYVSAKPLYERALKIWERALGGENPKVGTCLHNLGALEVDTGEFAEARDHLERALRIREKALGPDHGLVANTLTALASVFRAGGDLDSARGLYERALRIEQKRHGPDDQEVGWILSRLGFLLLEKGDIGKARSDLGLALSNLEASLGPEDLEVAQALAGLATATAFFGDSSSSNRLFRRALAIQTNALGPDHPEVGITLDELARSQARLGDLGHALESSTRSEEIFREHVRKAARSLTERKALGYAAFRPPGYAAPHPPPLRFAISVLAQYERRTPNDVARVWNELIRSRALVLDEVAARNRAVGDVSRFSRALETARQRLANVLVRGPAAEEPAEYRALVDRARSEADEAERNLADRSASFRLEQKRSQIGWAEVVSALPSSTALLAYAIGGDPPGERYFAFVLRSGERAPTIVPLGRLDQVDACVSRWRREVTRVALRSDMSIKEAESAYFASGSALFREVWEPIAPLLRNVSRVFIVPDGSLDLVSFAALPVSRGKYLIEGGSALHYLSAERDLVPPPIPREPGSGLLAIGGPSYDDSPTPVPIALGKGEPSVIRGNGVEGPSDHRGAFSDCDDFRTVRFGALPHSISEIEEIDSLWQGPGDALLLAGSKATESAVREKAPGRRFLHLATHGFFLAGRCASRERQVRGIGGLETRPERPSSPAAVESPFQLSGLALAGANRRNLVGIDEEDGILTAEEISSLDLSGVEWVVLSGCDTGIGEVRVGEGVLGMRRAFAVAGAGTVIMSLWPIEDEAARRWMKILYEGKLSRKQATAEAVQEATLTMLRERRAQALSTHPFYWAAFVAVGDWR